MSVLSQFCLARWKSVDSITPTALVYNLSRLDHRIIYAKISEIVFRNVKEVKCHLQISFFV